MRRFASLFSAAAILVLAVAFQNCNERLPKSAMRDPVTGHFSSTGSPDTTAPTLVINKAPAAEIAANTATFEFSSDDPSAKFECSYNLGPYEVCLSPKTYSSLADGEYRLDIRASDPAGNFSSTRIHNWRVNRAALAVTISNSVAPYTRSRNLSFTFSSQSASATFECKLNSLDYLPCVSPRQITGLPEGNHAFQVRARSLDGVYSAPASAVWTVDLTAPLIAINSGPVGNVSIGQTYSGIAGFTFSIQDVGGSQIASTTCRLDAGTPAACSGSANYTVFADGVTHTFTVTATDNAGNTATASRAFLFYSEFPVDNGGGGGE